MVAPAVPLFKFQHRWLADKARFKIGNMCRQIGKSFMIAQEAVDDALESGQDWVLLSAGERQSKELMSKVKMHCEAYSLAASEIESDDFWEKGNRYTMLTITLPNGARIMGLPANPDTARGFSANVILDEFAFHKDSRKIWKALFPTISRGFKIRIVSTPQGLGNQFHSLMTGRNNWSKHTVDIHQAVADGVPHNIAELKEGLDDPDAWDQEFLVLFIDDASAWLTFDMIEAAMSDQIAGEIQFENINKFWIEKVKQLTTGRLFAGMDISRRKDLTVLALMDQVGDVFWQRGLVIFPKVSITKQKLMLWDLMNQLNIERICIDSTGLGMSLGEDTVEKYGTYKAEAVEFTNAVKQDMANRVRNKFEDRLVRIANCRKLRDDLHAVKKTTTAAGNTRFDAERTDLGHADRFWAISLALMASDEGAKTVTVTDLTAPSEDSDAGWDESIEAA